ncbi:MAG: hypothetical protein ABR955_15240 [Verrucomicrobiota bacterium]
MRILKAGFVRFASLVVAASVQAQNIGVGTPGPMPYYPDELVWHTVEKERAEGRHSFCVVNGKIYDSLNSPLWRPVTGQVTSITDDGALILDDGNGVTTALKNYSGDGTAGKEVQAWAMRVGTYNWGDIPLQLWDCGKPYIPPPPTPAQIKAAQDAAKIAELREKQKEFLAESNAVVWLQSQATNGDAGAQCSLGEHYLTGLGCETNRTKAVYWLTQAANQGDLEASNKLAEIQNSR